MGKNIKSGFKKAMLALGAFFGKEKEELICHRCKKPIMEEQAFILVRGDIMMYSPNIKAHVFTCPEQAFNYAQRLTLHSTCWMDVLNEHGVALFNMDEVVEEYKKKGGK